MIHIEIEKQAYVREFIYSYDVKVPGRCYSLFKGKVKNTQTHME